jgi:hypothetical protein
MNVLSKRTTWFAAVPVAIAIGFCAAWYLPHKPSLPPITSYEKMGHLVALKVNVADVIEYTKSSALNLPWTSFKLTYAGTKVLLIVKGDCLVSTDLTATTYENTDVSNRTVTIMLPTPTCIQPRLIHGQQGTKIFATSMMGIERIILGDATRNAAVDEAMAFAQDKVAEACKSADAINTAKESTEKVLKGMLITLKWNANIKWK